MFRGALLFVAATALCLAVSGLKFPIVREFHFAPGTTAGFEYSEENLFETIRLTGTVDCVHYSFNSTRKMHAALYFQRWEYLMEYAANFSAPPVDDSIVPHSACFNTKTCEISFGGEDNPLPSLPGPRRRSGLNAIPYTVAFWYDVNNTDYTNVTLVVDAPCYTGELETLYFPAEPLPTNNTQATNKTASG